MPARMDGCGMGLGRHEVGEGDAEKKNFDREEVGDELVVEGTGDQGEMGAGDPKSKTKIPTQKKRTMNDIIAQQPRTPTRRQSNIYSYRLIIPKDDVII